MSYPLVVWERITTHSSSVNLPGLFKISNGTVILPISCNRQSNSKAPNTEELSPMFLPNARPRPCVLLTCSSVSESTSFKAVIKVLKNCEWFDSLLSICLISK